MEKYTDIYFDSDKAKEMFPNEVISEAIFENCRFFELVDYTFANCKFKGTTKIDHCIEVGIRDSRAKGEVIISNSEEIGIIDCDFNIVNVVRGEMEDFTIIDCRIEELVFENKRLNECFIKSCDVTKLTIRETEVENLSISTSEVYKFDLEEADVKELDFHKTESQYFYAMQTEIEYAYIYKSQIDRFEVEGSDFNNVNIKQMNIVYLAFDYCYMRDCEFLNSEINTFIINNTQFIDCYAEKLSIKSGLIDNDRFTSVDDVMQKILG